MARRVLKVCKGCGRDITEPHQEKCGQHRKTTETTYKLVIEEVKEKKK